MVHARFGFSWRRHQHRKAARLGRVSCHPLLSTELLGLLGLWVGGRFVCSCAMREKLETRVITDIAKSFFIQDIPSNRL